MQYIARACLPNDIDDSFTDSLSAELCFERHLESTVHSIINRQLTNFFASYSVIMEKTNRVHHKKQTYIWAAMWENRIFAYVKTKTQISFAVTAKLISAFVFATRIVQSLSFLNAKFQASSHFLRLRSLICVGPGRKPRRPVFWRRGSYPTFCGHGLEPHLKGTVILHHTR